MNTKLPNFGGTSASGNDSKYFQTTKKGEIHELKEELANPKMEKKKEAVKKVIAAMTVGKDVVMLFTDVVNCIQTQNIELKKLVYLYLINYAKSNPDLAILAVNTFVKVCLATTPPMHVLVKAYWVQLGRPSLRTLSLPPAGHQRPQSSRSCLGSAYDGLHPCRAHRGVLV